jgi:transposase-like protein
MTMMTEQDQARELPDRWSAKAKTDVVLRLLRGDAIEAVSREIAVPAHEVESWRRQFLDGGLQHLKRKGGDPEDRAIKLAQAKVGELAMKLELAEMLLEKRGYGEELTRLKSSRGL